MIRSTVSSIVLKLAAPWLIPDIDPDALQTIRRVKPFTLTSAERVFSLIQAVRYVVSAGIAGSFVECGVWRGGSMMAAALTLQQLSRRDFDLHLFDTFEGMTAPTERDVDFGGSSAAGRFSRNQTNAGSNWCRASLEDVQANLGSTGYDRARMHFVKGKVEETIPAHSPDPISILRLDTDWYESTRHEMIHLFPRLVRGGVLIVDDYGHWEGSRRAVDEYFEGLGIAMLLNRVDYTGRVGIKV
jgi:O-methyltransferase